MTLKKNKKIPITENRRWTNPKLGLMHSLYLAPLASIEEFPNNANVRTPQVRSVARPYFS